MDMDSKLIVAFVLVTYVSVCMPYCYKSMECTHKGQEVSGTGVLFGPDCTRCSCYGSYMSCCSYSAGSFFNYPSTCKVISDDKGCKKLVLAADETQDCDGSSESVG